MSNTMRPTKPGTLTLTSRPAKRSAANRSAGCGAYAWRGGGGGGKPEVHVRRDRTSPLRRANRSSVPRLVKAGASPTPERLRRLSAGPSNPREQHVEPLRRKAAGRKPPNAKVADALQATASPKTTSRKTASVVIAMALNRKRAAPKPARRPPSPGPCESLPNAAIAPTPPHKLPQATPIAWPSAWRPSCRVRAAMPSATSKAVG